MTRRSLALRWVVRLAVKSSVTCVHETTLPCVARLGSAQGVLHHAHTSSHPPVSCSEKETNYVLVPPFCRHSPKDSIDTYKDRGAFYTKCVVCRKRKGVKVSITAHDVLRRDTWSSSSPTTSEHHLATRHWISLQNQSSTVQNVPFGVSTPAPSLNWVLYNLPSQLFIIPISSAPNVAPKTPSSALSIHPLMKQKENQV